MLSVQPVIHLCASCHCATVTAAVQHPYGESDTDQIMSNSATGPAGYVGAWAFAGKDFGNGQSLQFQSVPYPNSDIQKHQVNAGGVLWRVGFTVPAQMLVASAAYKYMKPGTPFLLIDGNKTTSVMQQPGVNGDTKMVDAVTAAAVSG